MGVTYHRGTQRSCIFMVHPERKGLYQKLLKGFLETEWKDCFTDIFSNLFDQTDGKGVSNRDKPRPNGIKCQFEFNNPL